MPGWAWVPADVGAWAGMVSCCVDGFRGPGALLADCPGASERGSTSAFRVTCQASDSCGVVAKAWYWLGILSGEGRESAMARGHKPGMKPGRWLLRLKMSARLRVLREGWFRLGLCLAAFSRWLLRRIRVTWNGVCGVRVSKERGEGGGSASLPARWTPRSTPRSHRSRGWLSTGGR